MIILGIVLAAGAVAAGAAIVTASSSAASLGMFGHHVPGVHTSAQAFIAGAIVATFVFAGIAVSWLSLMRSVRLRRELRDLRDDREESMSALLTKNQQLQQELARARRGTESVPPTVQVPVGPQGRGREPASPFFDQAE